MAEFTFAPLTPVAFLQRAASAFARRPAVVDGRVTLTYRELAGRVSRGISALAADGIGRGDRVAALCANSHVMIELHNAVPARGAVLVPLNIRLSADEIGYILEHSGARLLIATHEFAATARAVAGRAGIRLLIAGGEADQYEAWLASALPSGDDAGVIEERQLLAINYTSGTTGRPKGVMYHHRGAYLQAVAMAYHLRLDPGSRYLWVLPMFHCDGWCLTWAVTAAGGTHVCQRAVDPAEIWHQLSTGGISHFSGAPTVLTMIAEHPSAAVLGRRVQVSTGGAPPSPALLARLEPLGMDVTHLYGLTETFGPVAVNEWQPEWDNLAAGDAARLRARQGIGNIIAAPLRVLDLHGTDVPADGQAIGELAIRGNDVMLGYYRDEAATAAVTRSGCFLTGDLAVKYPDGYVEIRDRSKDIIISGGENIASVEVERAIDAHPGVVESAVVGMPDAVWGEVPVAFVTVREGEVLTEQDVIEHVRSRLARFKAPRKVIFAHLPRTSTGKIQKNVLRAQVRSTAAAAGDVA
jgi:fatty-acyl-CoA synthase